MGRRACRGAGPRRGGAAGSRGGAEEVPLGRVEPAQRRRAARLVVYRRPVEARAHDPRDLEELAQLVLTDLVADLLGLTPEQVDPDAPGPDD